MKIFAVLAEFSLTVKPDWLDGFRIKYDKPYNYHITLKNSTYIKVEEVEEMKSVLATIVKKYSSLEITFSKYFIDEKEGCIMVLAEPNNQLMLLQLEIREQLAKYGEHVDPLYKGYECNFKPHITIGRDLVGENFENAKRELREPIVCRALVDYLVVTVIANRGDVGEAMDERNRVVFGLNNL